MTRALTVVLPVHDGADLVGDAVAAFVAEVAPAGGEVVVVDDASADATAEQAEASGARVVRLAEPSGPYVARNAGWAGATTPVIAFVDVRCRPRPGWSRALLAPFAEEAVALVGGDVEVAPGPTVAAQAAHALQPLRLASGTSAPFLPYAPTCHLAVHRAALEAVGGFADVRGGGDVDLCWAVQHHDVGRFVAAPDAVLDWVPRSSVADLRAQYARYGHNHGRLARAWGRAGCPRTQVDAPWRVALHALRHPPAGGGAGRTTTARVALVTAECRGAYAAGLRRGLAEGDAHLGPRRGMPA